ncbi:MAG: presqualene diphosphate synthase HpnD [Pseudorhodoplanes sp.]|nr:presqualene diphosphate synthase HpnD [Pseudorhodoplanes sp.]
MQAATESTADLAARRASGSSFYAGMRILPKAQRKAIYEIYSFCRAVDDVADEGGPKDERLAELNRWRADVDALYAGRPTPRIAGLAGPLRAFKFAREDFLAIIDGMEMDVHADIQAPDYRTLDLYCDRVASAVGRLCVKVFGMGREDGIALAYHLGRALQLTNIVRDIDEDAQINRLYLPREALDAAGIAASDPRTVLASPQIGHACAWVLERAQRHFDEADFVMARSPRKTVRMPRAMAEAYKVMLSRMIARGFAPPRERVRLGKPHLIWIMLRYALF